MKNILVKEHFFHCIKNVLHKMQDVTWWEKMDSNHRSKMQQIYSLPPLAAREFPHIKFYAS